MYCGECGNKLENDDLFCGECGTRVELDDRNTFTGKKNIVDQEGKNFILFKRKKVLLIGIIFTFVLLVLGYHYFNEKFGPIGVIREYMDAIQSRDVDALYGYLDIDGDSTFVNKETFNDVVNSSQSNWKIMNYTIGDIIYGEGKLSARVKVNYILEGTQKEQTETFYLIKNGKKKMAIFDDWELHLDNDSILVKDYQIKVPKDSKVTIGNDSLDGKYLDKKGSTQEWDIYKIPQIFKFPITIHAIAFGLEVTEQVIPSTHSYTVRFNSDTVSKGVEDLEKQVEKDVANLYQYLIEHKKWEDVKGNYSFKGADLSDLQEVYESLYESIVENEGKKLKNFEVTSSAINSFSYKENGLLQISVKLSYDYIIDYKNSTTIGEKIGDSSAMIVLYYQYHDSALHLIDGSYLVSYFSAY